MKLNSEEALKILAVRSQPFVELFRHGTLSVEMYRPQGSDLQQPHDRDELYVVVSGNGQLECGGRSMSFGPNDVLFVPAFTPHRFVDFSDDFATWVFFYGPTGGEQLLPLEIERWDPMFRDAFFELNKAWIEADYPLEPLDIAVLSDPQTHILDKGGEIIAARIGGEVVGVVALRPFGENTMELTKMAVDRRFRGRGIGEKLMHAILEIARGKGLAQVILYSNSNTSAAAVQLYYKVGFQEIPLEAGVYARANIKMKREL